MKSLHLTSNSSNFSIPINFSTSFPSKNHNSPKLILTKCNRNSPKLYLARFSEKPTRFIRIINNSSTRSRETVTTANEHEKGLLLNAAAETPSIGTSLLEEHDRWNVEVATRSLNSSYLSLGVKLSLGDQAFILLSFMACVTSVAFASFVMAAVPTLHAMGRVANSLSKLADTAKEEIPSTMSAIRLSGMEISDLTLELSDLSHEISSGISDSSQAVQAAEAGIHKIGSHARQQTISIIQERASLPIISLQPFVMGAAKKTSNAVGQASRTLMNIITQSDQSSKPEKSDGLES